MGVLFNPNYCLKEDEGRVLILHKGGLLAPTETENSGSFGSVHPLHGAILACCRGDSADEAYNRLCQHIEIRRELFDKFVNRLLDCEDPVAMKIGEEEAFFPPMTLISSDAAPAKIYDPEHFLRHQPNLKSRRPGSVSSLTLMVNNICATDCFYCYADKRIPRNCSIPFERIEELIDEAVASEVAYIDLIGGEVFLYPKWRKLIALLVERGFNPLISTKVPLTRREIEDFKATGMKRLQVSLDSLLPDTLSRTLRVKEDYAEKMKQTLRYMTDAGLEVAVHSIVTSRSSLDDLKSVYDFLATLPGGILYWRPDLGGPSIYSVCKDIEPKEEVREACYEWVESVKDGSTFPVESNGIRSNEDEDATDADGNGFFSRSLCSGNYFQMFILPDGDVTICEELYWHPRFIIGNVKNQSLREIWNSEKATGLYCIGQNEFPAESACSTCGKFNDCRSVKQVCYRDIIRKHGEDKWYLPDVNCPMAKN